MGHKYRKVHGCPQIQRLTDLAFIPPDPRNRDYQEFLASGEELLDAVLPPDNPPTPDQLVETLAELMGVPMDQLMALAAERLKTKR